MSPKILCDICQDTLDISQFLFSPCGHGFCKGCTPQVFPSFKKPVPDPSTSVPGNDTVDGEAAFRLSLLLGPRHVTPSLHRYRESAEPCPICRKSRRIYDHQPHPVYLHFEDSDDVEKKTDAVTRWMTLVGSGVSVPIGKFGSLSETVREVTRDLRVDEAVLKQLIESTKRLEEKYEFLFWDLQQTRYEKGALYDRVVGFVGRNNEELATAQSEASRWRHHASAMISENAQQMRALNRERIVGVEKDREIARLKAMVDARDREIAELQFRLRSSTVQSSSISHDPSFSAGKPRFCQSLPLHTSV